MIKRPRRKEDFLLSLVSLDVCGEPEEPDKALDFRDQEVAAGSEATDKQSCRVTACKTTGRVTMRMMMRRRRRDKCNMVAKITLHSKLLSKSHFCVFF